MEHNIRELIKQVNSLSKNTRKKLRELLIKIEEQGGYIALNYVNCVDFYKQEFDYAVTYLSKENSAKDIELLLGLEIGSYKHKFFPVDGRKLVFSKEVTNKAGIKYKGIACSLNTARNIKIKWLEICKKANTDLPSTEEIIKIMPERDFNESNEHYKAVIANLKEENKKDKKNHQEKLSLYKEMITTLQERNQDLEIENKRLKKELSSKEIPSITRNYIISLKEEIEKLKNINARLERRAS